MVLVKTYIDSKYRKQMKANQETILIEMMHADEDSGLYDSIRFMCVLDTNVLYPQDVRGLLTSSYITLSGANIFLMSRRR